MIFQFEIISQPELGIKISELKAQSIASTLTYTLADVRNEAKQNAAELLMQLKQDQQSYSQLTTRTGSREEEDSYTVSDSKWYNPFSWGNIRTICRQNNLSHKNRFIRIHELA